MKKVEIPSDMVKMAISLKSFGIDGCAWRARDALVVISYLSDQNAVILGGDVYKIKCSSVIFVWKQGTDDTNNMSNEVT